jgi:hypothetical protein
LTSNVTFVPLLGLLLYILYACLQSESQRNFPAYPYMFGIRLTLGIAQQGFAIPLVHP